MDILTKTPVAGQEDTASRDHGQWQGPEDVPTTFEADTSPQYLLRQLASRMQKLGDEYDELKAKLSEINKEYDNIRLKLLPDLMAECDIKSITLDGIGRVGTSSDMYVSSLAENKENLFEWLRSDGSGDLIQETVNASTLKAWVKERIEHGKNVPENLIKVTPFTRASITKVRAKK